MNRPAPFEVLWDKAPGAPLPLPSALERIYGTLRIRDGPARPFVMANFASTVDGVVALKVPGESGGGEITGHDSRDRLLMGILRASADAVIVGAGTLRAVPRHLWTADHVFPGFHREFAALRSKLGKPPAPVNVIVTRTGELDPRLRVFSTGEVPVWVVTGKEGARTLSHVRFPPHVRIQTVPRHDRVRARDILKILGSLGMGHRYLLEGGPHLMGDFLAEHCLDELFLTVSPQVAGRLDGLPRPGLVTGAAFAPRRPLWGRLVGVRRGGDLLFLRYSFPTSQAKHLPAPPPHSPGTPTRKPGR